MFLRMKLRLFPKIESDGEFKKTVTLCANW
jgi:hypothetical protein